MADAWAFEILNHIAGREAFETNHLELKSQLTAPKDFAPQLAVLANAARWHPVLVLFGVDRRDIRGIDPFEVGDWYAALRACFEYGQAPGLAYSNFLLFNGHTVGILVLETDNPPYVIGSSKKGGPREIPWRYGSSTGPAGRAELLQVLTQKVGEPEVEIFKIELKAAEPTSMVIKIEMFIYPARDSELVIPFHRIDASVSEPNGDPITLPRSISFTEAEKDRISAYARAASSAGTPTIASTRLRL